jgi:tRNA threonylcarbamoyladenosine biosynthesis protein TsaB
MSNTSPEGGGAALTGEHGEARVSAQPLTLCIDGASDARSVAVSRGATVIAKTDGTEAKGHSSVLLSDIDATLRAAGIVLAEIELFAVVIGPGSFTGLRAALATTKAFAATVLRRIAPVPTLHAVALSAGAAARTVAMIPAGRGEVFAQTLGVGEDGRVAELSPPAHVPPASLVRQAAGLDGKIMWAGSGALAHAGLIRDAAASERITLLDEDDGVSREPEQEARVWRIARAVDDYALEIARLSLNSYLAGATVRPEELRALYVRASDAELNEQCLK